MMASDSNTIDSIDELVLLSGEKIESLHRSWSHDRGAPVYTVNGRYTNRGWTAWTLGFHYGSALMQYELTGEEKFLDIGRKGILESMPVYLTHTGIHDHGFHIVSTYGNLLRLMNNGSLPENEWERQYYELALKVSGAVQAMRWTELGTHEGFIHSFNGPHSLFADTMRSLRSLALAHSLGHELLGEQEARINLLHRLLQHVEATLKYNVYYGEGRDTYDVPGRVAHESVFNVKSRTYRCPSSQQGYSPFTTWMRGLAWVLLGSAEQLEYLSTLNEEEFPEWMTKRDTLEKLERAAIVTAEFYLQNSAADGIAYWDSGAPGLTNRGDYRSRPADPFNDFEPVDSSASVIAAQGLLRLGMYMGESGSRYSSAGHKISNTLFARPYLSENPQHQGLILHSIYHKPGAWDHIPDGRKVPSGESSMWGDYHARELLLMINRMNTGQRQYSFLEALRQA